MSVVDFALGLAGVPQATIAEVEKASPAAAELLKLFKDNQALLQKIEAVYAEATPLINQAIPLIKQAQVEIAAIMPAAQDVVAFLQSQKA